MVKQFKLYIYTDADYACPQCGKPGDECGGSKEWGFYGSHCPDCEIDFETPDT